MGADAAGISGCNCRPQQAIEAATQAIKDEDTFIRKVREASDIRQAEAAKGIRRQLNKDRKRHSDLNGIIKKLYESY